jgi:basic amino acid/polyamine antiporter, APA family
MSLTRKKSLAALLAQASESHLKRTLTAKSLVALGIGAIIGAGLFIRTALASAEAAGPSVIVSFVVGAIGCAFAGLCYAEFAAMIPIAGSAYTYAYTTMGEFAAWIIGWALILEYAMGAGTVAIGWSQYLNRLLTTLFGSAIPFEWCHSPLEASDAGVRGIINLPALFIIFILTALLVKGTQESATVNAIIVAVKVAIVLMFIFIGWKFINPANHTPFTIPANFPGHEGIFKHGWGGVLGGAGIVFFAYIGFDAVSTAAQETKNPGRDMPIGILGSLAICTVLYILFGYVLTGVANWTEFIKVGKEASVAYAVQNHMPGYGWLATAITVAVLFGFSSVILVMLLGQSRVFYSMASDGLLPKVFSDVHPKFCTPYKCNITLFFFVGTLAAFIPDALLGNLTTIGTLFAFALVSIGIWIMRRAQPDLPRPFKTPLVPLVPILGAIVCTAMMIGLDRYTQITALGWMLLGFVVYFLYSRSHSKLNTPEPELGTAQPSTARS